MDLLDRAFVQHTLPCPTVLPRDPAPAVATAPEPVAACPASAITGAGFTDEQILAELTGLLAPVG